MKKFLATFVLVAGFLTYPAAARAEEGRFRLHSHGKLLFRIDSQMGKVSLLDPGTGKFYDLSDADHEAFNKSREETIVRILKQD